jgi:hypothetical protein
MKLLSKEDPCLRAMFRIYSDIHEGLDLAALVQIARDFSIVPMLLTMELIIAIFERGCSLGTDPKMRARLSYPQVAPVSLTQTHSIRLCTKSH